MSHEHTTLAGWRFWKRPLLALVALGLAMSVTGCGIVGLGTTKGSGSVKAESRAVSGFTRVRLSGAGILNIAQTGTESLTISAEDNLLPVLTSDVSDGTLTLGVKQGQSISPTKPITYTLTVKQLTAFDLSGAASINAVNIKTDTLTISCSGAGAMTITGSAQSQSVTISGSGSYNAREFQTADSTVKISGIGSATVSASQTLNATISGAGSVTYYGSPKVSQSVSGAGSIKQGK
ncbi:MAG: head GIN domain-containing protein [Ktedonobacterales bacterium]